MNTCPCWNRTQVFTYQYLRHFIGKYAKSITAHTQQHHVQEISQMKSQWANLICTAAHSRRTPGPTSGTGLSLDLGFSISG